MLQQLYEKRIVAFIDILGFKECVKKSETYIILQHNIYKALDYIHSYKQVNDDISEGGLIRYGVHVTTFSDSAVISYPLNYDGGLYHVCIDIIQIQQKLLDLGFFIRGGITIGDCILSTTFPRKYHENSLFSSRDFPAFSIGS